LILNRQIVLQGKQQSLTEYDKKVEVITGYLEKFGCIANRVITPQLYAIYIEALEDLPLRKIRQGMAEYLRYGRGWPWPGDLRDYCEDEI
jgi:hypothetical protein